MIRVAIVGGGPGGIFTAHLLEEKYRDSYRTTVFEACHRTGGKIVTSQFESAPVSYEAGVAELYNYAEVGPDPLFELVNKLGLKTVPMNGQTVVLEERILRDQKDIGRLCGRATLNALRKFRVACREAMPLDAWYEGNCHYDNTHPWAGRSCEELLDEVADPQARKYLKVAAHSDLATEPHLTNGLNGLKNILMDVPGYIRLYSVVGGIEQIPKTLRQQLRHTRILVDCPVTRIGKNADETYRVSWRRGGVAGYGDSEHEDFEVVFVAIPHNWLGSIEWGGEREGESLRKAMTRFIAYYDRPGHYLRVSVLFRKPFWRTAIKGSWFMLDAFGGCCVYDEGTRHDAGEFGVLSWLIPGTDALSMSGFDDEKLARMAMDALPRPLDREASSLFMEARVHRWPASVSAQPGGLPVRDTRSAHLPDPRKHPGLFMVGDYLFDSTLNGVLDSADFATDLLNSWILKRRLLDAPAATASSSMPQPFAGRLKRQRMSRGYFDRYYEDLPYEEAYDWYFDAKYVQDLIRIVWKAKPPYRLLDAGSASGLTLGDFARHGIEAWGVENNKYIHSRTPARWRKRNLKGDVRKLPFPDNHFDFVYETCLAYLPESQLPRAIRELHRVSRRGVIFASVTTDMNPELLKGRDLLDGMESLMTLWEWGELFTAAGFQVAVNDDRTLERLWRCEKKYNEEDPDWYPDRESLRYCFYTKTPGPGKGDPGGK